MWTHVGTCTLPDGRKVKGYQSGYHELGGFVIEREELEWEDGTPLTNEEVNEEIVVGEHYDAPVTCYLHEYVTEHGDWEAV